jgi:hypothetical protein
MKKKIYKSIEIQYQKKGTFINQSENKQLPNNEKVDVAVKSNGTFLYGGITIAVAIIVFVLYLWLEK